MATVRIAPPFLRVTFTPAEKVAGLVRNLDVPLSAVRSASAVPSGLAAARGVRSPGLGVPGLRKIGTWRGRDGKTLVSVRRGESALLLELERQRFDRVLVGSARAQEYVDELNALG